MVDPMLDPNDKQNEALALNLHDAYYKKMSRVFKGIVSARFLSPPFSSLSKYPPYGPLIKEYLILS